MLPASPSNQPWYASVQLLVKLQNHTSDPNAALLHIVETSCACQELVYAENTENVPEASVLFSCAATLTTHQNFILTILDLWDA